MKIMVTGGCGFIGTCLVHKLIEEENKIVVIDNQWFGNYLNNHHNLEIIKKDIREIALKDFNDVSTVIHLANIANDPAVELNQTLSWNVNVLATQQISDFAYRSGVKKFIYASSGSVYGIKDEKKVTEELTLVPISIYNKTKMVSERILLSYQNDMKIYCVRPATVCGYSPRMRLDLTVNLLTMQALTNKKITVLGGNQIRPNLHIKDMVGAYLHFLNNHELSSGCYNVGFENYAVIDIAKLIQEIIPSDIIISKSNDIRSYRLDSTKLVSTGFKPKFNIKNAVYDLKKKFNENILKNDDSFYTVKWMKKMKIN